MAERSQKEQHNTQTKCPWDIYVKERDNNGEPVPEWKQQLYIKKIKKQVEKEQEEKRILREKEERRLTATEPEWKQELLLKRQLRMMTSEDPSVVRRRVIAALQSEMNEKHVPPWQKELLRKRIEKLKTEMMEIEKERRERDDRRKESMAGPFQEYYYEKNIWSRFSNTSSLILQWH